MAARKNKDAKRDLKKDVSRLLQAHIKANYEGNTNAMALATETPQSSLNELKQGKGGLVTLGHAFRDKAFLNSFIRAVAGEETEDQSWRRIATNLSEILSLQEALHLVDKLQNLASYGAVREGIKAVDSAATAAEDGYREGRKRPLLAVDEKSADNPVT